MTRDFIRFWTFTICAVLVHIFTFNGFGQSASSVYHVQANIFMPTDSTTVTDYNVINILNTPAGSPVSGAYYLVGTAPTGAFVAHENDIALWNGSAYVFTDPVNGYFVYNTTDDISYIYQSGRWVRTPGIPILQNGNKLSNNIVIGSKNAKSFSVKTNNTVKMSITSAGVVGITNLAGTNNSFVLTNSTGTLIRDTQTQDLTLNGGLKSMNFNGQKNILLNLTPSPDDSMGPAKILLAATATSNDTVPIQIIGAHNDSTIGVLVYGQSVSGEGLNNVGISTNKDGILSNGISSTSNGQAIYGTSDSAAGLVIGGITDVGGVGLELKGQSSAGFDIILDPANGNVRLARLNSSGSPDHVIGYDTSARQLYKMPFASILGGAPNISNSNLTADGDHDIDGGGNAFMFANYKQLVFQASTLLDDNVINLLGENNGTSPCLLIQGDNNGAGYDIEIIANNGRLGFVGLSADNTATGLLAQDAGGNTVVKDVSSIASSGTYTPTLSNTTNVSASTPRLCTYLRVGNSATIAGQFDIDPTAVLTPTVIGISLPPGLESNFSTIYQAGGGAWATAIVSESAGVQAEPTTNIIEVRFICTDASNHTMSFTFTYQVL